MTASKAKTNIFIDSRYRRLRAGWRLILQILLLILFLFPTTGAAYFGAALLVFPESGGLTALENPNAIIDDLIDHPIASGIIAVATFVATIASVWVAGRFFDRRRFANFGLHIDRNWWIDLGFGLGLGAALMGFIFAFELAFGWITITDTFHSETTGLGFPAALTFRLLAFVCVGIYEELLFRGYQLKNMSEGLLAVPSLGPRGAILASLLISSALFGLAHAGNPNATAISTFNLILAGFFLALGYLLTGRLAIPIGLHITWNFFQGNVFGFPVSGSAANTTTLIAIDQGGNPLLTGGAFGPEAGLIGIVALLLGSVLIVVWTRARYGQAKMMESLAQPELRDALL